MFFHVGVRFAIALLGQCFTGEPWGMTLRTDFFPPMVLRDAASSTELWNPPIKALPFDRVLSQLFFPILKLGIRLLDLFSPIDMTWCFPHWIGAALPLLGC